MKQINTTIEIERPVEEVFDFLTDLDNAPLWTVDIVEIRHSGPSALGARGTDVRRVGQRQVEMPWKVTRYEPPFAVDLSYGDPFPATVNFSFESTRNGTRMACKTTLRLKGFRRIFLPLAARRARRTVEKEFRNVKDVLESRRALGGHADR